MLSVANVFMGLWTLRSRQRSGGLIGETKIPLQELEPNVQGCLYRGGGGG